MSEKHAFFIKKAEALSDEDFLHIVDKTAEAFAEDPSFGFLFGSRQGQLHIFIGICMSYFYRSQQMYICTSETGEVCGVSWWVESGGEKMSAKSMEKYGVFRDFKRLMFSLRPRSIYRIKKLASLTEKSQLKQPHSYLVLLAAFKKGAGGALMNDYIASHPSETIYLENSNLEDNTGFYAKHGFKPMPEIKFGELTVLPMVKQPGEGQLFDTL